MDEAIGPEGSGDKDESWRKPVFRAIALPFWTGESRVVAWRLTGAVVALVAMNVGVLYAVNRWNKKFFDAIEHRDLAAIAPMIALFAGLVAIGGVINYFLARKRLGLQAEWRRWLATNLVKRWLGDRTYYKLEVGSGALDNPEARLSEDLKQALAPIVDMAVGLFNSVLAAITFLGVLAFVGGAVSAPIGGATLSAPFGFVLVAVVYAAFMSVTIWLVGRPLIPAVESNNGAEAALRFELTRVRESAESIALIAGEEQEQRRLESAIGRVASTFWGIAANHGRITMLTNVNTALLPVVPLLVGAPKYIAGQMSLGDLMQVAAAFVQVQVAFNWVMDNFIQLTTWRASVNRLAALVGAIDHLDRSLNSEETARIRVVETEADAMTMIGLNLQRDDGVIVVDQADAIVQRGDRVIVTGESGTGKSTLIRAIAGLWPWGQGEIAVPAGWRVMFMPQTPYLPLGTLRASISYPNPPDALGDEDARAALDQVGLSHLAPRLDDEEKWHRVLSGGERQRIAFARALLSRPDLIVMDEATSALDEESQTRVMQALIDLLPDTTLISVAHRPSLAAFHTRSVALKRLEAGVYLVRGEKPGVLRGVRRILGLLPGRARISGRDDGTKTQAGRSEA
ncbi:MAG: ABC transporter ATP-binding protein/permease [Rhodoblastus sp.]